jgi:hypothetical protein
MPEPRYRGESWQASILRANIEAADAERRAEAERAEREAEAKRARAARHRAAPAPKPTPTPKPAETPPPTNPRRALGWQALSPEALRRF